MRPKPQTGNCNAPHKMRRTMHGTTRLRCQVREGYVALLPVGPQRSDCFCPQRFESLRSPIVAARSRSVRASHGVPVCDYPYCVADSCSRRQHSESCGSCMPLTGFTTPACTLRCSQQGLVSLTDALVCNRRACVPSANTIVLTVPQPSCPIRGLCAVDREPSRLGLGVWPFGRAVRCAAHVPWCAPLKSSANPIASSALLNCARPTKQQHA